MHILKLSVLILVGFLAQLAPGLSSAQSDVFFRKAIPEYPDLQFPAEMRPWGTASREGNDIFKPAGAGPFPAVVLAHTCGGIEPHIYQRAQEILNAGYAVLVLDAYTSRKHFRYCTAAGVGAPRYYKDAYDGLAHLLKMKEVEPSRIYLVGFSLGSFVAAVAGSPSVAQLVESKNRFRASVGWYGNCIYRPFRGPQWDLIRSDVDRPVLLLLAGKDTETPIKECFPLLESLKSAGKPVDWHVYPDATHAWDKDNAQRGYAYNAEAVTDAMRRTLEFLDQHK